jgi:thiol-disulfide isomerase/thioredoxin
MRAMRRVAGFLVLWVGMIAQAAERDSLTEAEFRGAMNIAPDVKLLYRNLDCASVDFEAFSEAMRADGVKSGVERAMDGSSVTVTVRRPGGQSCPSPYDPVTRMPSFDLRDLAGKRVTSDSLKGKPTLVNFYFSECVPCILEVGPINGYAAEHPEMNFLAVTFDEAAEARQFVARYRFQWRVVPDARDFIDRMKVKQYPLMALFDANGRLLGLRPGGVRDELEAVNVAPRLARWVDGLLRVNRKDQAALGQ